MPSIRTLVLLALLILGSGCHPVKDEMNEVTLYYINIRTYTGAGVFSPETVIKGPDITITWANEPNVEAIQRGLHEILGKVKFEKLQPSPSCDCRYGLVIKTEGSTETLFLDRSGRRGIHNGVPFICEEAELLQFIQGLMKIEP